MPFLAGVDEAGRGPLAGPVVAAAVILPFTPHLPGLADSKCLTPMRREALFDEIRAVALSHAVVVAEAAMIDRINILQATLHAMREAIRRLTPRPGLVLVDGDRCPGSGLLERAIVKGDQKSAAIMAASILAKVTRDRIMVAAHAQYPQYGFDGHKGYGSARHLDALRAHGPCPLHRRSFAPVRDVSPLRAGNHPL